MHIVFVWYGDMNDMNQPQKNDTKVSRVSWMDIVTSRCRNPSGGQALSFL